MARLYRECATALLPVRRGRGGRDGRIGPIGSTPISRGLKTHVWMAFGQASFGRTGCMSGCGFTGTVSVYPPVRRTVGAKRHPGVGFQPARGLRPNVQLMPVIS